MGIGHRSDDCCGSFRFLAPRRCRTCCIISVRRLSTSRPRKSRNCMPQLLVLLAWKRPQADVKGADWVSM
jgi:hypothetical protein